jgi:hypothetical protein
MNKLADIRKGGRESPAHVRSAQVSAILGNLGATTRKAAADEALKLRLTYADLSLQHSAGGS